MPKVAIPLKFKDGKIVRNLKNLKQVLENHPEEVLMFIKDEKLKDFFDGLAREDLSSIWSNEKEPKSTLEIMQILAKKLEYKPLEKIFSPDILKQEKDASEQVVSIREAAGQGDADAQNNLGVCYERGDGVPEDHSEAVKWYREAAGQGDADAQNNLDSYKITPV